jgi:Na+/melibiose symporter-like transporter
MFEFVEKCGLTAPALAPDAPTPGGILEWLGDIVHSDRMNAAGSNVADVFNSIINMAGTATTIIVIILSPPLSRRFGKKAIAVAGFGLASLGTFAFYLLSPTNVGGMMALTILIAICYAPTIPLVWAIFADVADDSEWKTGRRFTGKVFGTICFALKAGLGLGSWLFLTLMEGLFHYDTQLPGASDAVAGYRVCSGLVVGVLFVICTALLLGYQPNKHVTLKMAEELAERRRQRASA